MSRSMRKLRRALAESLEARHMLSVSPQLLADINSQQSSNPRNFAEFDGRLFYVVDYADFGAELWSSDGTAAGTSMFTNIAPAQVSSSPDQLTRFGDWLYFTAYDQPTGRRLWRTDGTLAGTTMFAIGTNEEPMVVAGGNLYFSSHTDGAGLWKTNGVAAPSKIKTVTANSLVAVGNEVYFIGTDNPTGSELWKSDGTSLGTVRVKDITPGNPSTPIENMLAVGGTLYFTVDGRLWKSDGTEAGTEAALSSPALDNLTIEELITTDGLVYFQAVDAANTATIWRSDGTDAGTELIFDSALHAGPDGMTSGLTVIDDRLHFFVKTASELGLWTSNGTAAGTQFVRGFDVEVAPALQSFAEHNGDFYFAIGGRFSAPELWKSDGTSAGTVRVADNIGPRDWQPTETLSVGDSLFFQANIAQQGVELWSTDGTPGNISTPGQPPANSDSSDPQNFVRLGEQLYFTANDGTGEKLWLSDGVPNNAEWIFEGSDISQLTPVGDLLYFTTRNHFDRLDLMVTDGTREGTFVVWQGFVAGYHHLTDVRGQLYFTVLDQDGGASLGIAESNSVLYLESLGLGLPPASESTAVTSDAFYFIHRGMAGNSVWRSDGTSAGTYPVESLLDNAVLFDARELAAIGDTVYFAAKNLSAAGAAQLWKTDGTAEGTVLLENREVRNLTPASGNLFFLQGSLNSSKQLWMTDGSPGSAQLVTPLLSMSYLGDQFPNIAELNGAVYYLDTSFEDLNVALWRTTGPGNIEKVSQLSGVTFSFDKGPLNLDGAIYFQILATVYQSDGTARGTHALPVYPSDVVGHGNLARLGETLYFANRIGGGEPAFVRPHTQLIDARLFYNDSKFDQDNAALNAADDQAIATDKSAYRAGDGLATFANVSSYTKGINGVMLDFAYLSAELSAEDFVFRIGKSNDVNSWDLAPAPQSIAFRQRQTGSSEFTGRVSIAWANAAISNTWLEVTVLANERTGLAQSDTFYFGSKVADSGTATPASAFSTTPTDSVQVFATLGPNKSITDPRDYNRDGQVTPTDSVLVYHNLGELPRLNLPAATPLAMASTPPDVAASPLIAIAALPFTSVGAIADTLPELPAALTATHATAAPAARTGATDRDLLLAAALRAWQPAEQGGDLDDEELLGELLTGRFRFAGAG